LKDEGIIDPEEEELSVPKKESETEAEINQRIDATWEDVKNKQIKEEAQQEELDDLWNNEALVDEFISQIKPEQTTADSAILTDGEIPNSQAIPGTDVNLFEDRTSASSLSSVENAPTCSVVKSDSHKTAILGQKKRNRIKEDFNSDASSKSRRLDNDSSKELVTQNVNTTNDIPHNDHQSTESTASKEPFESKDQDNYWASDSEEDMDMDFLANIQSYF
jgi:hypothetical protein